MQRRIGQVGGWSSGPEQAYRVQVRRVEVRQARWWLLVAAAAGEPS
ncbi:MAG: hypothetical protein J7639_26630 [Paenibacillaceae bacterium]|nr:hypothetical protein [Paenibacillaceae bacterium]